MGGSSEKKLRVQGEPRPTLLFPPKKIQRKFSFLKPQESERYAMGELDNKVDTFYTLRDLQIQFSSI
jgi:hypothetical protein